MLDDGQAIPARSVVGLPPDGTGSFWVAQEDPLAVLTAAGPAQAGMLSKQLDGPHDRLDHAGSGGGIVEGDEGRLGIKVGKSTL